MSSAGVPSTPGRLQSAPTVACTGAGRAAAGFPHASLKAPVPNVTRRGVPSSAMLAFFRLEMSSVTVWPSALRTVAPASVSALPVELNSSMDDGTVSDASMRSLNVSDTVWCARLTAGAVPAASAGGVVSRVTSTSLSLTAAKRLPTTSVVKP